MATYFGQNPPFVGGAEKVLSRQEDIRLIKNDILQLIMTSPGERVHRPNFGTAVRETISNTRKARRMDDRLVHDADGAYLSTRDADGASLSTRHAEGASAILGSAGR